MAEPENSRRGEKEQGQERLYTLSDVAKKTGISMPTLQRYKKLYQGRIPSTGSGRKQRYPESALPVFDEIKNENIGRRGRPRKDASAAPAARGRKPGGAGRRGKAATRKAEPVAARRATPGRRGRKTGSGNRSGLLTLTEISKTTGISYPTLVRYVRLHLDRLPHEGKGRARRFHPEAVDIFRQLRQESGRGGRKPGSGAGGGGGRGGRGGREEGGAIGARLKAIERAQQQMERRFQGFAKSLQRLFK